jgi:hypothetical protein
MSDQNQCSFYMWSKLKDTVYSNIHQTADYVKKKIIQNIVP